MEENENCGGKEWRMTVKLKDRLVKCVRWNVVLYWTRSNDDASGYLLKITSTITVELFQAIRPKIYFVFVDRKRNQNWCNMTPKLTHDNNWHEAPWHGMKALFHKLRAYMTTMKVPPDMSRIVTISNTSTDNR